MTVHVFITGPLRPSVDSVRTVVSTVRREFPGALVHLCVWKSEHDIAQLKQDVDTFLAIDEPDTEYVRSKIYVSTLTDNRPDCALPGWSVTCYKMMYAITRLCDYVQPQDTDVVVRIRSDAIFQFQPGYIEHALKEAEHGYVVWQAAWTGRMFNDWFGISTYANMKKAWYVPSLDAYNTMVDRRWNQEDVIRNNLIQNHVPILPLNMDKTECYILRGKDDGSIFKHYYR